jgi:hypothetical protein
MNKLPEDILNLIITYTYTPQNKKLLDDIRDYYESKSYILSTYSNKCLFNDDSDLEWIINDIFRFANEWQPSIYGYKDKFIDIWKRHFLIKNYEQFYNHMIMFDKFTIHKQINLFWALMTIDEREEFIKEFAYIFNS